jgi:hypothetical protein
VPHVASKHERHHGKVVGNGHCVAFVREVTGLPPTAQWRRGAPVWAQTEPVPGTAIATFDESGRYGNHTDGRSHAAILMDVTDAGLVVYDQWLGKPVSSRVIRFKDGAGKPVDDGDAYSLIEVATE